MQSQNVTRTCDNLACVGCNGNMGRTVETIANGVTNRPDINWVIGYTAVRSGDNTQLNPTGLPLQFCQFSCIVAYLNAAIAAASAPAPSTPTS